MTRKPLVAGMFYEAEPAACRAHVEKLFREAERAMPAKGVPDTCVGGLVPHAGWVCSGAVAALTLKVLAREWTGRTFVLLGAVHSIADERAMLYPSGSWRSPLGEAPIDEELAAALAEGCEDLVADAGAHAREHSLEVQVPLIQFLCPEAAIVPIMVPPTAAAAAAGREIGRVLRARGEGALVIGSTDLTHYGPRYGITAAGVGRQGMEWAIQNDRRLLRLIEEMQDGNIVADTNRSHSACGGGAIAATIAACRELGAAAGKVLWHTNSCETLRPYGQADTTNVVGYASVVFA